MSLYDLEQPAHVRHDRAVGVFEQVEVFPRLLRSQGKRLGRFAPDLDVDVEDLVQDLVGIIRIDLLQLRAGQFDRATNPTATCRMFMEGVSGPAAC